MFGRKKKNIIIFLIFFSIAFTEGDGHNGFYGPDPIMETCQVILITIDYRLSVLGFMNFELPGLSNNLYEISYIKSIDFIF